MPQLTVEYDENTEELLDELKDFFQVKTRSGVIRRALAVAKAAKKYSDKDGSVTFVNPSHPEKRETYSLRT